ncbi:hypothetical protein PLESTM_000300900 [Pleodorina starrii]|nr:hypothetical protein PLESTM_000300900 [Pleodorina starrii]
MGAFGTPRARPLGMPVPWTRGVAEAWRAGLRQLNHLSVRLALRCDGLNGDNPLPLQTHNMPLPVGGHTTHLGMFIDDHGQELDDFDEHTVTGLILLVSTLLAGCLSGLKSLDLSLAGPGGPEGNFGLGTLLRTMANSPLAQLGELLTPAAGGIGPKVLRRLTLDLEAAALLAGALPVLLSPPGDDAGCGGGVVTTVVASALGPFTDLLAALSALRGTRVALRLACYESLLDNAPEAVAESLAAMGPHAAALALPANPDSGELENALQQRMGELRELEVAFDTPYTLPPMSQRKAWTEHLRELDLLGAVGCLTRLGLTFKRSLKNMEGEIVHWHEAADVDAHLAAVVRACPQLKALDITIIEDKLLDEDEGERALASWRGAKAAAAAGADLDRWRPAGCPNPVPSLHCLANLPALERLSLQLDVITTQGLSGLVEDEVRMLLETVEKRRSWRRQQRAEAEAEAGQERNEEAALPEPPLSVWCPQLSRDAARRLSRLAAQLAGRETAPGGGWDGETWLVDCTHRG